MTVPVPNRFDNVAAAAGSGVDVDTILDTLKTKESEFGDLDGDAPKEAGRTDIGTPTLEETLNQYDLDRPATIEIVNREEE
jgi:hypothetical protein